MRIAALHRHVHDVFVGTEHLVADIERHLKPKRGDLLLNHDLAEIMLGSHLVSLCQIGTV